MGFLKASENTSHNDQKTHLVKTHPQSKPKPTIEALNHQKTTTDHVPENINDKIISNKAVKNDDQTENIEQSQLLERMYNWSKTSAEQSKIPKKPDGNFHIIEVSRDFLHALHDQSNKK